MVEAGGVPTSDIALYAGMRAVAGASRDASWRPDVSVATSW